MSLSNQHSAMKAKMKAQTLGGAANLAIKNLIAEKESSLKPIYVETELDKENVFHPK